MEKQRNLADIGEDMRIFESTEGWRHISSVQKKLIKASLIITERAKRGDREEAVINEDPILRALLGLSAENKRMAPEYGKLFDEQLKLLYKHRATKGQVDDYYCNVSVYVLEEFERLRKESARKIPAELPEDELLPGEDFFSGDRHDFSDPAAIERALSSGGFPYVCHLRFAAAETGDESKLWSGLSFVVFGRVGNDYVVWKKGARREPYKRETLEDIIKRYPPDSCNYYVRPMKRTRKTV